MKVLLCWWLPEVREYQQQEGVLAHPDLGQASGTQETSMETPAPESGAGVNVSVSTSLLSLSVTGFHKKA